MGDSTRHDLFRYLVADETGDYLAVMSLFTATLLTDLSAAEVAGALAERGVVLTVDTVDARCQQLVGWGNLVPSIRDARVSTIADYVRSRSRFQVSKLGGRVHREAVEIMSATDGAREVARELLGQIVQSLDRVIVLVAELTVSVEELAGEVTTVFNNHRLFADSVRDFYAYLAGVLSRYDLGGEEYAQFKELLLVYIDLITSDVNRHAPAISMRLDRLLAGVDRLVGILRTLPGLIVADGSAVERGGGRARSDWVELGSWYGSGGAASGPEQLRAAAGQALGQLITNAKRLLDTSGTGFSRRADLLRLARWFNDSSDEDAHRLFAATFVAYPARHLLLGPEEPDPRVGPMTSWWHSDPVEVPVSLRERGDRAIRGRSSRVPDPTADRLRLQAQAEREAEHRRAAAAELAIVADLHEASVSPAARDLLLGLLGDLLARDRDEVIDHDIELRLQAVAGPDTVLHSRDGDTTVVGLQLTVTSETTGRDAPAARAVSW